MCELFPVILQYTYKVPLTLLVRKNDLKADDFPRCSYTLAVLILEFHSGKELELFLSLCNQFMWSSSHEKSEKDYRASQFC